MLKKEEALFILLFWEANPFGDHKHFINTSNTAKKSFGISTNFRNIF